MSDFKAGAARQIITPPRGIFLIGYGDRTQGNRGVHDDLTATALALDDGQTRLAIVALDLLMLNEFIVDRVRAGVGADCEVILCCSHTHSGPIGYADERSPGGSRAYMDWLVERIVLTVQQALNGLQPARLAWSQGEAEIAVNRRERQADGHIEIGVNPEGPVDRSVQVLSVLAVDGARLATLVNFACHGTVLGPNNLLASADWVGYMRGEVEGQLGGLALFLQGATGDMNPSMGWGKERVWDMARSQGQQVAEAVAAACRAGMEPLDGTPVRMTRGEAWLALEARAKSASPPRTYRDKLLGLARLPRWMGFLTDWLLRTRFPWKSRIEAREGWWSVPLRVNTARIGDLALVTFAAETFTEIGQAVKAQSPARHTLFASVSDGSVGYLFTAEAYPQGGYEVDVAPYAYRYPARFSADSAERAMQVVRDGWQTNH